MAFNVVDVYSDVTAALLAEIKLAGHLPHSGEKGGATEHVLRQFLNRTLPSRFEAVTGFTFGRGGQPSGQSDILIIDNLACTRLLRFQGVGLYPIDAVVARIEVTTTHNATKAAQDIATLIDFRKTGTLLNLLKEEKSTITHASTGEWKKYDLAPPAYLFAPAADTEEPDTIAGWLRNAWNKCPDDRKYLPGALIVPHCCVAFFAQAQENDAAPWLDPEDATHIGVLRRDGEKGPDITLGFWIDLLLSNIQGLLDRRCSAHAASVDGEGGPSVRYDVAQPFIPTLLPYFHEIANGFVQKAGDLIPLQR